MGITSIKNSLLKSIEFYETRLKNLNEEEFQKVPSSGGWSYSEVYSHIMQANIYSLIAIEKCIAGTGKTSLKRINWIAGLILFFGKFPPGRFKAPEQLAKMVSKISIEEASNLTIKFRQRMLAVAPQIAKAEQVQKIKHPRLGLLNAGQWFRFIEVHTRHHIRQLKRIQTLNDA